jgi:hypothetical protein
MAGMSASQDEGFENLEPGLSLAANIAVRCTSPTASAQYAHRVCSMEVAMGEDPDVHAFSSGGSGLPCRQRVPDMSLFMFLLASPITGLCLLSCPNPFFRVAPAVLSELILQSRACCLVRIHSSNSRPSGIHPCQDAYLDM